MLLCGDTFTIPCLCSYSHFRCMYHDFLWQTIITEDVGCTCHGKCTRMITYLRQLAKHNMLSLLYAGLFNAWMYFWKHDKNVTTRVIVLLQVNYALITQNILLKVYYVLKIQKSNGCVESSNASWHSKP